MTFVAYRQPCLQLLSAYFIWFIFLSHEHFSNSSQLDDISASMLERYQFIYFFSTLGYHHMYCLTHPKLALH